MRIALVSVDTRGGVQPYVALALGLKAAGHEVRLLAPAGFSRLIEPRGLDFRPLTGDIEAFVRQAGGVTEGGSLTSIRKTRELSMNQVRLWTQECLAHCAGVDCISGGVGGLVAASGVAEKLGVPFLETHLQPIGQRTTAFPGVLLPGVPAWLGPLGRRLSHALTDVALWTPFAGAVKAARREVLGLPERSAPARRDLPVLYGISPHVVPKPPDWEARRHLVGYWTLPAASGWRPPPALEAFLSKGPPPVSIGFGSMGSSDPRALSRLVLEAVAQAGVRAVLLSGWGALEHTTRDDVLVLDEAPHDWLFPRMAAVVHHGGAGTTGAAARAGVPALVVPFTMDQPFWGAQVHALGVGPRPIPRSRLSVERLAAALKEATTDSAMRARAATLGEQLRAEDGVAAAVAHFDALPAE